MRNETNSRNELKKLTTVSRVCSDRAEKGVDNKWYMKKKIVRIHVANGIRVQNLWLAHLPLVRV